MGYSNWLLDERFGRRERSYLVHVAKAVSSPLMAELGSIWSDDLQSSAGIRFRGKGGVEVNMLLLSTYYVMEKHREALLWSFFVARMDPHGKGLYRLAERAAIVEMLTSPHARLEDGKIKVTRWKRASMTEDPEDLLQAAHLEKPKATRYTFTSMDGYALADLSQAGNTWPLYSDAPDLGRKFPPEACDIDLEKCFGSDKFGTSAYSGDSSTTSLFKRVAFEHPECGDCITVALLAKSGERGLEAFLPKESVSKTPGKVKKVDTRNEVPPVLGDLAKTWQEADFSLKTVLGNSAWMARDYAVRLLQRYAYVVGEWTVSQAGISRAKHRRVDFDVRLSFITRTGESETQFISLQGLTQIRVALEGLLASMSKDHGPVRSACVCCAFPLIGPVPGS